MPENVNFAKRSPPYPQATESLMELFVGFFINVHEIQLISLLFQDPSLVDNLINLPPQSRSNFPMPFALTSSFQGLPEHKEEEDANNDSSKSTEDRLVKGEVGKDRALVHSCPRTVLLFVAIEGIGSSLPNEEPLVVDALAYNAFVLFPVSFHHLLFVECVGHWSDPHCVNNIVSYFPHVPTCRVHCRGEEDFRRIFRCKSTTESPTSIFSVDNQLRLVVHVSEELGVAIGGVDQLIHSVLLRFNSSHHKEACVFELPALSLIISSLSLLWVDACPKSSAIDNEVSRFHLADERKTE